MMSFTAFLVWTLRRLINLMGCLLSFLKKKKKKTVPPCWHSARSISFTSTCQHLPFLPAGSVPSYSVPKKDDRSNPSNHRPIVLLSCLSKAFESILNLKIQKHLLTSYLIVNIGCTTGDLFSLLTDSWSSSLSRFGETLSVALDISKASDRVWHKSLLSKLPSFDFYPSLCSFISSFLSGRTISAVVDGQCSSSKPINNGVPQGFVLSRTLFL